MISVEKEKTFMLIIIVCVMAALFVMLTSGRGNVPNFTYSYGKVIFGNISQKILISDTPVANDTTVFEEPEKVIEIIRSCINRQTTYFFKCFIRSKKYKQNTNNKL
jgi:hypothetical protein